MPAANDVGSANDVAYANDVLLRKVISKHYIIVSETNNIISASADTSLGASRRHHSPRTIVQLPPVCLGAEGKKILCPWRHSIFYYLLLINVITVPPRPKAATTAPIIMKYLPLFALSTAAYLAGFWDCTKISTLSPTFTSSLL